MTEKEKIISEILEKIRAVPVENRFILSHASTDGIISAFAFTQLFGKCDIEFAKSIKPKFLGIPEDKSLAIVFDLILNQEEINELSEKNIIIINFDHHHVLHTNNKNYLCLNPKRILKKENFSSSTLVYELFKDIEEYKEKIAGMRWLFACASLYDGCYSECMELLNSVKEVYPEFSGTTKEEILISKLFEISEIINHSKENPKIILGLLERAFANNSNYREIYNSELFLDWVKKNDSLNQELFQGKMPIKETKNFVFINSSGKNYSGSYAPFLNLHYKDNRVYLEYYSGKLLINSYFNPDIEEVSRIFNGIKVNDSLCEAYTQKRFDEIINYVINHFELKEKQAKLF